MYGDDELKQFQDRARELDERVRRFSELATILEEQRFKARTAIESSATRRETGEIAVASVGAYPDAVGDPRTARVTEEVATIKLATDRLQEREIDLLRKERELLRHQLLQTRADADRNHALAETMREELSRAMQQMTRMQEQFSREVEKTARERTTEVVRQLDDERKRYQEWKRVTTARLEALRTVHPLKDYLAFTEGEIQKLLSETRKVPPPPPGTKQVLEQALHRFLLQRDQILRMLTEAEARVQRELGELQARKMAEPPAATAAQPLSGDFLARSSDS